MSETLAPLEGTQLRRSLRLKDLILFGIVCVTPIAPIPLFGILQSLSHGQAVTTVAIALLAMLPTAVSYGRMAARYPVAGSAYTYVARGLHPQLGFVAGWAMSIDYFLIPIANVIYCAATLHRVLAAVPYPLWVVLFASLCTFLNLRGIRTGVRANQLMLAVMSTVLAVVITLAIRYVAIAHGVSGLVSLTPFYDPAVFDLRTIGTATSFAAFTYIGFDAVTTLAEEVVNPTRNVARATVFICLITGAVSILVVYLGQLAYPHYEDFRNLDTAFLDVSQLIGGRWLLCAMVMVLLIAQFGSALTGQAGASRLLYGMGKAGVIPSRLFAHINAATRQPSYNVWFIGLAVLVGALLLNFERAGELLNFGAFLAFMGVNLAALRSAISEWRAHVTGRGLWILVPFIGFLSCLIIWLSLPAAARHVGFTWMAIGLIYQAVRTRGFRIPLEFAFDKSA